MLVVEGKAQRDARRGALAARLADRALVFSRRPGRIRAISPAPMSRRERADPARAEAVARWRADLWSMIRDEAAAADRETIDG